MRSEKAESIVVLYDQLYQSKQNFSTYFQEITDFILPYKSNVNRQETPGVRRGVTRYDSTAVFACEELASMMTGTIFPRGQEWMYLTLEDNELAEKNDVKDWLEDCRGRQLEAMAQSNFYSEADELNLDLVGYGTANMFTKPKDQSLMAKFAGLAYKAFPIDQYVFSENDQGMVDTVYRKFKLTAWQAKMMFEKLPGFKSLGESIEKALAENDKKAIYKEFEFIHTITPREIFDPKQSNNPQQMPVASIYVGALDKTIIAEGGFPEMPCSVPRWRMTTSDAGWGRGPGLTALPDARSLNEFKKIMHKAAVKDLNPPLLVENKGVLGSIRTHANGVTYKRRGAEIDYLTSGQRMDLAQFDFQETKQQVRSYFYADQLHLPPPASGDKMTATETQIRWEIMQRLLGPTLGRIENELLNPIVYRTFNIMMRQGAFLPPPEALKNADTKLEVKYQGPLARAQKMADVQAIERIYAQAQGISAAKGGDPAPFDILDDDEAMRHSADLLGVPNKIIKDKKAVSEEREGRAQQMEEAQGLEAAGQVADIAGKLGKGGQQQVA